MIIRIIISSSGFVIFILSDKWKDLGFQFLFLKNSLKKISKHKWGLSELKID